MRRRCYGFSMALRHAVLAALLDGETTGYDLARVFDVAVANFWHALPQQIYAELARLEAGGLVSGRTVVQESRPNKRLFSITPAGRAELRSWTASPPRPTSLKDDVLVRVFATEAADFPALAAVVEASRGRHEAKLARYRKIEELLLGGLSEEEFLRTAPAVGPYLTLRRGIRFEEENIAWCTWAAAAIRLRAE